MPYPDVPAGKYRYGSLMEGEINAKHELLPIPKRLRRCGGVYRNAAKVRKGKRLGTGWGKFPRLPQPWKGGCFHVPAVSGKFAL